MADGSTSERFSRAEEQAHRRGKPWALREVDYLALVARPCVYCGRSTGKGVGLDRIDNRRGYLLDNVLPCCGRCNRARGAVFTVDEMHRIAALLGWCESGSAAVCGAAPAQ